MTPLRLAVLAASATLAIGAALPSPAAADPPCGRGWRRGEWCGPGPRRDWDRRRGPGPGYAYAPPPYSRPPYGYAPPPYAPPPSVPGVNVFIPFR